MLYICTSRVIELMFLISVKDWVSSRFHMHVNTHILVATSVRCSPMGQGESRLLFVLAECLIRNIKHNFLIGLS